MGSDFVVTKADLMKSQVIDPGWYEAQVSTYSKEMTKKGDKIKHVFTFVILDPKYAGKTLFVNFTEGSLGFMKDFLNASGIDISLEEFGESRAFSGNDFVGKNMEICVSVEEYEGKQVNKITSYR